MDIVVILHGCLELASYNFLLGKKHEINQIYYKGSVNTSQNHILQLARQQFYHTIYHSDTKYFQPIIVNFFGLPSKDVHLLIAFH